MAVRREYANFDLVLHRDARGSYVAEVSGSPVGEGSTPFVLPFSDQDVELFLLRIGQARSTMRRHGSAELEAARDFGRALYDAAFGAQVGTLLERSLDEADRTGRGLRLRLHLAEVPELADLPWEFVYSEALGRFLAASTQTPLVRYVDLARPVRPLTITPPLRVLVMIASPSDHPPLDVDAEWRRLELAFRELVERGLVTITRARAGSLAALQRHLRRGEFHVLHFIGHGGFDESRDDGVLVLENERGGSQLLSGEDLGMMLHDHQSLRLAVLNACEGARSSRTDPFSGTGKSLIRQGIPAVVAMQFEISDRAAVEFSRQFYEAVADGYPVDAAMGEARKALFARGVEWGTPVLYMRSSDGQVFHIERPVDEQPSTPVDPARAGRLLDLARESIDAGDWVTAVSRLEDVLAIDPDNAAAADLLTGARTGERVGRMYDGARLLFEARQWDAVLDRIEQIRLVFPTFADPDRLEAQARDRIAEAERQARLDSWHEAATRAADAGQWEQVVEWCQQIAAEDPEHEDVQDLLPRATAHVSAEGLLEEAAQAVEEERWQAALDRFAEMDDLGEEFVLDPHGWRDRASREIEEARLTRRLDTLYETTLALMEGDRWDEAARIIDEIERERPAYRGVDTFRARVEAARAAEDAAREAVGDATPGAAIGATPGAAVDVAPVRAGVATEPPGGGDGVRPPTVRPPIGRSSTGRSSTGRSSFGRTPLGRTSSSMGRSSTSGTQRWWTRPIVVVAGLLAVLAAVVVLPRLVTDEPSGEGVGSSTEADGTTTSDDTIGVDGALPPVVGEPPSTRVAALYYTGWAHMGSSFWWPWAYLPVHDVYDWTSPAQLAQHFAWLRQARVGVAMLVWQGRGSLSDEMIPAALDAAERYGIEIAFAIDAYEGRSVESVVDDVAHLYEYGPHPAFHWTSEPTRWQRERQPRGLFWILAPSVISSGDEGEEPTFVSDPTYWEPAVTQIHDWPEGGVVLADGISPDWIDPVGFDGTIVDPLVDASWAADLPDGAWYVPVVRPGTAGPDVDAEVDRRQGETYADSWQAGLSTARRPELVLIDSFNDWGVGTQIEPVADAVATSGGAQFRDYGDAGAESYLGQTASWVDELLGRWP